MKFAVYWWGSQREVGVLSNDGSEIAPLALRDHAGALALVQHLATEDPEPKSAGLGTTPPVFLKAGDVVRIEIDGVGRLGNPI